MDEILNLYRQHASAVFRFAWGLCGDRSTAEDLVSETFTRLLTRAPRIETRTALAYLLAVARNTYLSGRRRQGREVPLAEEVLRDLPEGEWAALLLRVDHDLSYEEIAIALGVTVGAAKVRVHRARLRLANATNRKRRSS